MSKVRMAKEVRATIKIVFRAIFIGDLRGDPGDELHIMHRLLGSAVLAVSLADLSLELKEGQPFQGQERSDLDFPTLRRRILS